MSAEKFSVGIQHPDHEFTDSLSKEIERKGMEADMIIGKGVTSLGFDALVFEYPEGEVSVPEGIVTVVIGEPATEEERSELATYYLEEGADNYFSSDENPRVIALFLRNAIRRVEKVRKESKPSVFEDISVDDVRRVVTINGQTISVTKREFDTLRLFVKNPEVIFTRDQVLETVWELDFLGESRTVDVHVRHLRDRLAEKKSKAGIKTVRGVGYGLVKLDEESKKYGYKSLPGSADLD